MEKEKIEKMFKMLNISYKNNLPDIVHWADVSDYISKKDFDFYTMNVNFEKEKIDLKLLDLLK